MTSYPMNIQPRLPDPEDGGTLHLAHPVGDSFMHEDVELELHLEGPDGKKYILCVVECRAQISVEDDGAGEYMWTASIEVYTSHWTGESELEHWVPLTKLVDGGMKCLADLITDSFMAQCAEDIEERIIHG